MVTRLDEETSPLGPVLVVAPQESTMSALLFLIYIKNLPN